MDPTASGPMPSSLRWGYAWGGIASGTFGTVPGLLLLPYLTDELGVAALWAGLLVFVPKAWDFVLNPVAGRISDTSANPRGHRRPMMLRAGLAMGVGFALLFWAPSGNVVVAVAWVLLVNLGCATAYAFFQVPYLAMSAEVTDDYTERTTLMTRRVVVISCTILLAGGLAPLLASALDGVSGYRLMAAVMGAIIVVGTVAVIRGTRQAPTGRIVGESGTWREQMVMVLGNRHCLSLLVAFVLQAIAMTMVLAGTSYTARHVFDSPELTTVAFICFVAPAIAFAPLWGWVGERWGKKTGFVACSLVLIVGLMALVGARGGHTMLMLGAGAIVGVGYAGAQIFPLAMLPDVAAYDARVSGRNRIGMLTGTWAGFELLGFATGPFCYALVLTLGGFQSGAEGQSGQALDAIVGGVSVVPAFLVLLSLVAIGGYRLDAELRTYQAAGTEA